MSRLIINILKVGLRFYGRIHDWYNQLEEEIQNRILCITGFVMMICSIIMGSVFTVAIGNCKGFLNFICGTSFLINFCTFIFGLSLFGRFGCCMLVDCIIQALDELNKEN